MCYVLLQISYVMLISYNSSSLQVENIGKERASRSVLYCGCYFKKLPVKALHVHSHTTYLQIITYDYHRDIVPPGSLPALQGIPPTKQPLKVTV